MENGLGGWDNWVGWVWIVGLGWIDLTLLIGELVADERILAEIKKKAQS